MTTTHDPAREALPLTILNLAEDYARLMGKEAWYAAGLTFDKMRDAVHALASSPAVAAEAGEWVMVPREATEAMIDMGRSQSSFPEGVWRAMIQAAPPAPSGVKVVEAAALTHEQIAKFGLGLEYVHSVLRWAACGYVNTPEQIANLHTAYRIVDKLVNATPSPSPAATQEPYYLWSHPRETARVCRPSEATFSAGDPEWVREYPVEAVGVVMNRVFEGRATKTASLYESGESLPVGTLLYAHPLPVQVEERQPLTEASIELGREEYGGERFDFKAGARFAERFHGIGSAGMDGGAKSHE